MKKIVNIHIGTDLPMTTPTHPLSCAIATKRMIEKIAGMPDSRFDINTNSEASVRVFQIYGAHGAYDKLSYQRQEVLLQGCA